ncbi:hypothetical protein ACIRRI_56095, partial [Streptomyces mirabilis]|uniref:hypothetical protein n=1 Tax=Streptomyces mirabilis TaxID=68239 RepID=UPI00381742C3
MRPQFGHDMAAGAVALLPSQRRVPGGMQRRRAGAVTLRQGLRPPGWAGRASHLYAQGVDLGRSPGRVSRDAAPPSVA